MNNEESATMSKVMNEFRKLFQRKEEWKGCIEQEHYYLRITISQDVLSSIWEGGAILPYEACNLVSDLGWKTNSTGEYITKGSSSFYTTTISKKDY